MNNQPVRTSLVAAGRLEDAPLVDDQGDAFGKLEAILVHIDGGRVAYAVVSYGSLFDQGFRHVAIPWEALTVDSVEHRIALDVDRDRLDDAPSFVANGWPKRVDDAWMSDLHQHYGLRYAPDDGPLPAGGLR